MKRFRRIIHISQGTFSLKISDHKHPLKGKKMKNTCTCSYPGLPFGAFFSKTRTSEMRPHLLSQETSIWIILEWNFRRHFLQLWKSSLYHITSHHVIHTYHGFVGMELVSKHSDMSFHILSLSLSLSRTLYPEQPHEVLLWLRVCEPFRPFLR